MSMCVTHDIRTAVCMCVCVCASVPYLIDHCLYESVKKVSKRDNVMEINMFHMTNPQCVCVHVGTDKSSTLSLTHS